MADPVSKRDRPGESAADFRPENLQIHTLILRNLFLIVLCILASGALMWYRLATIVPTYSAQATLVLDDVILRLDPFGARLRARTLSMLQLATEVEVMNSREFAARVAEQVLPEEASDAAAESGQGVSSGKEDAIDRVLESYQTIWHPTTFAIDILATDASPQMAAEIANGVASNYADYTLEIQRADIERTRMSILSRQSALKQTMAGAEADLLAFTKTNNLDDLTVTQTLTDTLRRLEAQLALASEGGELSTDAAELQAERDATLAKLEARAAAEIEKAGYERKLESMRRQDDLLFDQIEALAMQDALLSPVARQVTVASPSTRPVSPSPRTEMAGALISGLTFGFILALLRENLRGRLRWPQQITAFRAPVLGHLPPLSRKFVKRMAWATRRGSLVRALHKISPLYTTLRAKTGIGTGIGAGIGTGNEIGAMVLVTSPGSREGRSTISFALAAHAAAGGENVLLVDLDPSQTDLISTLSRKRTASNFHDLLANPLRIDAAAWHLPGHPSLSIIAPAPGAMPMRFGNMAGVTTALSVLRRKYSLIVVDCPPVLCDDVACRLGSVAQSVLLVARMKKTRFEDLSKAAQQLELNNASNVGIVVNDG
ncbi:Exopolysaccharide transport protein [Stappia aggregata IAM 12614]|uniref:Exopolysaccharide transport protein n=1 Tax=Roseibium aggregatum (strain ATCC 25650 / DSM 13394 / JCM 20685 / NBRC 16684 / NCIMB 2208 / IAM 12614 / B1) TaxID=384765 RepID=A0NNU2_ROSAI|nr:Exopolysaccharide transport protein [Stappia aggregata IAM 12614] [Roseibium aggregatum IAM 12614]